MFDVGWTELLLIGVVALIVIGPKDLPVMFHTLGRITARARGMAREFSSAMEDAAKASGVQEATRELRETALAFAKGIARTAGERLVWDLTYRDGRMLVNDVDLSAMAGGGRR